MYVIPSQPGVAVLTHASSRVLNDALSLDACVHSHWMPACHSHSNGHLPILSGIQPAELCRMGATFSLAHRGSLDPDHILYGLLSGSSNTRQVRLRSKRFNLSLTWRVSEGLRGIFWTTLLDLASALLNKQITNGKRSTVKMLPGSVLLCPGPVPGLLGWAYPEQLGLSSTACGLVLGDSIHPCTDGVSLLHRNASVAPLNKPQNMQKICNKFLRMVFELPYCSNINALQNNATF